MQVLMILGLGIFLLVAPGLSYADGGVVETVTTTVKENPGKSVAQPSSSSLLRLFGAPQLLLGEPPTTATCKNF